MTGHVPAETSTGPAKDAIETTITKNNIEDRTDRRRKRFKVIISGTSEGTPINAGPYP
jgi:hypothetical protein